MIMTSRSQRSYPSRSPLFMPRAPLSSRSWLSRAMLACAGLAAAVLTCAKIVFSSLSASAMPTPGFMRPIM
jgi:hypothetical protein